MTVTDPNRIPAKADSGSAPRPILKWAGGKTQLLPQLLPKLPQHFNTYIEPFFGGGALFFAVEPTHGTIADRNPELINLYTTVRDDVEAVIEALSKHENVKSHFLDVRAQDWPSLAPAEAAARTIFLNKTCFNGLYRVNRSGGFNVPFGNYKNPKFLNEENLIAVSQSLNGIDIQLGDYKDTLKHASPGDFVFIDPPYIPVSEYSDFRRYTKEQFSIQDHIELAEEVHRLYDLGCHVILTNSNHPLVHDLYSDFEIEVFATRRHVSARADRRLGEDVIVTAALSV